MEAWLMRTVDRGSGKPDAVKRSLDDRISFGMDGSYTMSVEHLAANVKAMPRVPR